MPERTQDIKNLRAVAVASKNYTDKVAKDLQWQFGTYDLGVDTNTDTAHIKTLPSGTIQTTVAQVEGVGYKVNQIIPTKTVSKELNGISITSNNDGTYTIVVENATGFNQVELTTNGRFIANHKYLNMGNIKVSGSTRLEIYIAGVNVPNGNDYISTVPSDTNTAYLYVGQNTLNGTYAIKPQIFDLTADFGSGNEPSTVSDCASAYLQRGINIYEYTPQQSSIKNNAFTGVKVEGSNLANPSLFELGSISVAPETKGQDVERNDRMRSNYIEVKPSTTYTLKWDDADVNYFFYDENKVFISNAIGGTFTTTATTKYVRFYAGISENPQILFNEGTNSTYIPYTSQTISVDLTTIKDSNNVSLFPSGKLMGTNNADFITPYNQESRWNEVDLGTLDYTYNSTASTPYFTASISDIVLGVVGTTPNMITTKYTVVERKTNAGETIANDMSICNALGNGGIIISNSNYTDATTFKTAMSGVKLQYERKAYLTSNTDLTSLTKINAQSNGTITLNNTDNVDMPNTIKSLKEVAK